MRPSFLHAVLTGALCLSAASTPAQDLAARLKKATDATDLDSFTAKPWDLKLQVTTFDDNGKNPQVGNIEVKANGQDRMTSYTFPSGHRVDLISNGQHFQLATGVIPFFAEAALRRVLHVGPEPDELEGAEPSLGTQKMEGFSFECITLAHKMKYPDIVSPGIFPSYCFRAGTDDLRVAYDYGAQLIMVNSTGKFGDRTVPVALNITDEGHLAAMVKLTGLSSFQPQPDDFAPPANAVNLSLTIPETPHLQVVFKPIFVLPDESVRRGLTGVVVMRLVVGPDGHAHNIRPVTYPDGPMLSEAIVMARKLLYKPYVVNGVPTTVPTTFTAVFGSGGGVDTGGIRH